MPPEAESQPVDQELTWESEEWPTFDVSQYGPDGTTVVAVLSWWVCPSCGTMVPGTPDDPDYWRSVHRGAHEEIASMFIRQAEMTEGTGA